MHTHISAVHIGTVFLGVVIVGTFWRIGAGYASRRPGFVGELGRAAAVQF